MNRLIGGGFPFPKGEAVLDQRDNLVRFPHSPVADTKPESVMWTASTSVSEPVGPMVQGVSMDLVNAAQKNQGNIDFDADAGGGCAVDQPASCLST